MDFACEMMDLCRGTQEVEAVLSEGGEENGHTSRDPLARLKMAIEYEEKKVRHNIILLNSESMNYSLNNTLFSTKGAISHLLFGQLLHGLKSSTRMHSRRMHTARLLNISPCVLRGSAQPPT